MKRRVQVIVMAVAFDLYWTLVVLFRERGLIIWLALAIIACLMLPPAHRIYALLLAIAGSVLDLFWTGSGLIEFNGGAPLPLWVVALWLMFATVWTELTRTTTLPPWLLTLLATVGGPLAYLIGERLGAMTFLQAAPAVIGWMAAGWMILMMTFHIFIGRRP